MAVKLTASADLLTLDTIHLQRSLREKRDESSPLGGDVSGCILPRDIISKLTFYMRMIFISFCLSGHHFCIESASCYLFLNLVVS